MTSDKDKIIEQVRRDIERIKDDIALIRRVVEKVAKDIQEQVN